MKNNMIAILLIVTVFLAACSTETSEPAATTEDAKKEVGIPDLPAIPIPDGATSPSATEDTQVETAPTEDTTKQAVREIDVEAFKYDFEPNPIVVKKGERVILHVTSRDVAHGIAIPEYGINEKLPVGQTVDIEFTADKPGTFQFYCNVFCGSGHGSMRGDLVIE